MRTRHKQKQGGVFELKLNKIATNFRHCTNYTQNFALKSFVWFWCTVSLFNWFLQQICNFTLDLPDKNNPNVYNNSSNANFFCAHFHYYLIFVFHSFVSISSKSKILSPVLAIIFSTILSIRSSLKKGIFVVC